QAAFVVARRDVERSVEGPEIRYTLQIRRIRVIDETQDFSRSLQFMDQHFGMDEVVGTHDNKIEIAKTIDEITNHSHVIPITLTIQTVYASGASGNSPAVVKAYMPPVDKVRQCPLRASRK